MGIFSRRRKRRAQPPMASDGLDANSLQLPDFIPEDRVIEPQHIKEAVMGPSTSAPLPPSAPSMPAAPEPVQAPASRPAAPAMARPVSMPSGPLYVKVDVYQRMLGELEELKDSVGNLKDVTGQLEISEYNEEDSFMKMRRAVKAMHDRLLQIDRVLFKQ